MGRSALCGSGLTGSAPAWLAAHCVPHKQLRNLMALYRGVWATGLPHGRYTKVLDVGCGSGIAIGAVALAGVHRPHGIDPFAHSGRSIEVGGVLEKTSLSEVSERYVLVCFHHSFEHVLDPEGDLRAALSLLTPGGRVLARMSTVSSLAHERYGAHWIQLDPPRHTVLFSRLGVNRLAERFGAEVISTHHDSNSFVFWGSEQIWAGIVLAERSSCATTGKPSFFSVAQLMRWEREAMSLNAQGRGDQVAWVLQNA